MAFIKGPKSFAYLDFSSHITDYDLIKKAGRRLIQNYLSKINFPVFGVYERAPNKVKGKFTYHIHVVVACREDQLVRADITRVWSSIIQKLAPQTFYRTYVRHPIEAHPYKKFLYILKFKKFGKPAKPYGQKGSFYFHVNSQDMQNKEEWICSKRALDKINPSVLARMQSYYFYDLSNHRAFDSYLGYYNDRKTSKYKKERFKRI